MKWKMKTSKENPDGLHIKYKVKPVRRKIKSDETAEYFVLRLDEGADEDHRKACTIAVHAYAAAIETLIPKLAEDIRSRWPIDTHVWTPIGECLIPSDKSVEVMFDNGETRAYMDDWPFAEVTHFRIVNNTPELNDISSAIMNELMFKCRATNKPPQI